MITYDMNNRQNESLYEYFYTCIKNDIISGVLPSHEKLPSKRAFATNHGVSIVTVENAYSQLIAEGYIYSRPKSGFYVSPIDHQIISPVTITESIVSVTESEDAKAAINLVSNHTTPENFPFSIWAKIMRRILGDRDSNLMLSPPSGGVMALRSAIAGHLLEFRGIHCAPEQIIVGAGTEYLYSLIVQLLGTDMIYGLENPSSKKIRNIYQALGVKTTPLTMDQEGIRLTPENLTPPDIIQLSPSHHFPTGIVTSVNRRYGLLQWANASDGRFIIEDDYDSEFRLHGRPIPSLFSMDTTDKVIYFNTFTKSLASTIRISYMVLPKPLLTRFYQKLGFYACTVSNFEQYALASFIKEKYFEKHINRMRNQYRELRDTLIDRLMHSTLSDRITISEEHAGLHFLLKIQTDQSDTSLKAQAGQAGVIISFLSDYYNKDVSGPNDAYDHTAIVNYSGLQKEDIEKTVVSLEKAWSMPASQN